MRKLKWAFWIILTGLAVAFLDYTLPHHDVVRITDAYNRMTTVGWENKWAYASPDTGTAESATTRDIRFINGAFSDNSVVVYRNEDTGWVWPPYFKYDSSNLQAVATNVKSGDAAAKWVAVTYYGWRLPFLSIYPNAVRIVEVAGPDVQIIPYVNIGILVILAFLIFMLRRMWLQFWERMVDPAMAQVDEVQDRARGFFGRIGDWFGTWRKKG